MKPGETKEQFVERVRANMQRAQRRGDVGFVPNHAVANRLLTKKQKEVVRMYAHGLTVAQIASQLNIHQVSVYQRLGSARIRAGVNNNTALVSFGMDQGWIEKPMTKEQVEEALKKGGEERQLAERTLKTGGRF